MANGGQCASYLSEGPDDAEIFVRMTGLPASQPGQPVHLQWWAARRSTFDYYPLDGPWGVGIYYRMRDAYPLYNSDDFNGGNVRVSENGSAVIKIRKPSTYFLRYPDLVAFPHIHLRLCTGTDMLMQTPDTIYFGFDGPFMSAGVCTLTELSAYDITKVTSTMTSTITTSTPRPGTLFGGSFALTAAALTQQQVSSASQQTLADLYKVTNGSVSVTLKGLSGRRLQGLSYRDLGPGKCLDNGQDPQHLYFDSIGEQGCRSRCDEDANCYGYSVSNYQNCLLWMNTQGITGGGEAWGSGTYCYVKQFPAWSVSYSVVVPIEVANTTIASVVAAAANFTDALKEHLLVAGINETSMGSVFEVKDFATPVLQTTTATVTNTVTATRSTTSTRPSTTKSRTTTTTAPFSVATLVVSRTSTTQVAVSPTTSVAATSTSSASLQARNNSVFQDPRIADARESLELSALEFSPVYGCLLDGMFFDYFSSSCQAQCPPGSDVYVGQCVRQEITAAPITMSATWQLKVECSPACWAKRENLTAHRIRLQVAELLDMPFEEVQRVAFKFSFKAIMGSSRRLDLDAVDAWLGISVVSRRFKDTKADMQLLTSLVKDADSFSTLLGAKVHTVKLLAPGSPGEDQPGNGNADPYLPAYQAANSDFRSKAPVVPMADYADVGIGIFVCMVIVMGIVLVTTAMILRRRMARAKAMALAAAQLEKEGIDGTGTVLPGEDDTNKAVDGYIAKEEDEGTVNPLVVMGRPVVENTASPVAIAQECAAPVQVTGNVLLEFPNPEAEEVHDSPREITDNVLDFLGGVDEEDCAGPMDVTDNVLDFLASPEEAPALPSEGDTADALAPEEAPGTLEGLLTAAPADIGEGGRVTKQVTKKASSGRSSRSTPAKDRRATEPKLSAPKRSRAKSALRSASGASASTAPGTKAPK